MLPSDLQEAATGRYASSVATLARDSTARLLAIWDSLDDYTEVQAASFVDLATPTATAVAATASSYATAYATQVATSTPANVSPLIVADAVARLYDPFDRLGSNLAGGTAYDEALAGARTVVEDVGKDAAYGVAREAMGEVVPTGGTWVRRITGDSCPWCMRQSSIEFSSAAKATFGHARCDCVAVPAHLGLGFNEIVRGVAGFDEAAERAYDESQFRRRLRRSERTAGENERKARLDARSELDPARARRLLDRADHWHARRLRANQRLDALAA